MKGEPLRSFNEYLLEETDYWEAVRGLEDKEYDRDEVRDAVDTLAEEPELLDFLLDVRGGNDGVMDLYPEYPNSFRDYTDRLESAGMIRKFSTGDRDMGLTWLSRMYLDRLHNFDDMTTLRASD